MVPPLLKNGEQRFFGKHNISQVNVDIRGCPPGKKELPWPGQVDIHSHPPVRVFLKALQGSVTFSRTAWLCQSTQFLESGTSSERLLALLQASLDIVGQDL